MPYYDDFKSDRFKSAWAIGKHADAIFRAECRKRGLDPEQAIGAPLASLATTSVPDRQSMSRDQILNLWSEGLSRPEIIALGCHFNDFVDAIRRARAVGDSRAYYRHGHSRLPWQVNITETARRRARKHRIVGNGSEIALATISNSKVGKVTAMKKKQPVASSVGPAFVGKAVDDLVGVFAQIDEAKRELDKRFIPRSDVLRDNKD